MSARQGDRRRFLSTAAASGAALGIGDLDFLARLPAVSAAEAQLPATQVRYDDQIEPLVQLLEQTSRDQLLEAVGARIRGGVSYRELLAALLLASVRNVQPRPSVGFKFHAVLVVNSAHLASLSSPAEDRWLPIFWALDYFKAKQLEEESSSGWKLPPVNESAVPPASKARKAFAEAMDSWDAEAADPAVAGLIRTVGANEAFELFCRYGARDYRSIGHKAIFVANSWRTLHCIGWQHAEPVLRSLAFALVNHRGDPNPAQSDLSADRPWRENEQRAATIRSDWQEGRASDEATRELIEVMRSGSSADSADAAVKLMNDGAAPQSIWDAVLVGSGELLMRRPGIIGLHTLTTANALLYAFRTSDNDETRRRLLLQNCSFLPMFRESAMNRGKVSDKTIDDLLAVPLQSESTEGAIDEIFADVSQNRNRAASKVRSFLQNGGNAQELTAAARRLIFLKGRDAHDYKFSSAVLEDYYHASPAWRNMLLALSVFNLRGSADTDSGLVERTRAALG